MALKLDMKLREAIISITPAGAQPVKNSSTIGVPPTEKMRQTSAASTKAMTWLLVSAEKHAPTAR